MARSVPAALATVLLAAAARAQTTLDVEPELQLALPAGWRSAPLGALEGQALLVREAGGAPALRVTLGHWVEDDPSFGGCPDRVERLAVVHPIVRNPDYLPSGWFPLAGESRRDGVFRARTCLRVGAGDLAVDIEWDAPAPDARLREDLRPLLRALLEAADRAPAGDSANLFDYYLPAAPAPPPQPAREAPTAPAAPSERSEPRAPSPEEAAPASDEPAPAGEEPAAEPDGRRTRSIRWERDDNFRSERVHAYLSLEAHGLRLAAADRSNLGAALALDVARFQEAGCFGFGWHGAASLGSVGRALRVDAHVAAAAGLHLRLLSAQVLLGAGLERMGTGEGVAYGHPVQPYLDVEGRVSVRVRQVGVDVAYAATSTEDPRRDLEVRLHVPTPWVPATLVFFRRTWENAAEAIGGGLGARL